MGTVFCDNCGTDVDENAKFCRACGRATPLSEAATKRFDEQPETVNPTRPVGPSPTTPAYMAPFELAPAPQTNDLRQKTQRRNLIILAAMLAMMILALGGLLVFLNFGVGTPAGVPQDTGGITPPPPPPPPLVPPAPPAIETQSTIDPTLIYPGARQTLSINKEGKSVLQLECDAPVRTVAEWYRARLKVTKTISIVGQTILKAGDIGVVIMGGEAGAQIIITRGDGEN